MFDEDKWSLSSQELEEQRNYYISAKHTIPTKLKPLPLLYIEPFQKYLDQWKNDSTFYHDFIYACPFNTQVTKHFVSKTDTLSTNKAWGYLFDYFSTNYRAIELADLIYEALCELNEGEHYLKFLINHHFTHVWPIGDNFCDPSLPIPYDPTQ